MESVLEKKDYTCGCKVTLTRYPDKGIVGYVELCEEHNRMRHLIQQNGTTEGEFEDLIKDRNCNINWRQ